MNDIFWIKGNPPAPLAIVLRPRGDEWLEDELLGMRRGGIQTLVSLLEEDEAVLLGLADEAPIAEHVGLNSSPIRFPIPRFHPTSPPSRPSPPAWPIGSAPGSR